MAVRNRPYIVVYQENTIVPVSTTVPVDWGVVVDLLTSETGVKSTVLSINIMHGSESDEGWN